MPVYENSFNFWIEQENYIPTARLDSWPKNWYSTSNLRFFGSVSWVAAVPHDIESRIRLEHLHESIDKHNFFNPLIYENKTFSDFMGRTIYVSLIPMPVVDWFSNHTMDEIHNQIAMYIALYEIEEKYTNKNVIGDTHTSYHSAIKNHLSNFCEKYPHLNKEYIPVAPHDIFEEESSKIENYKDFNHRKNAIEIEWRRNHPKEAKIYDDKREEFDRSWELLLKEIFNSKKLPVWFLRQNKVNCSDEKIYMYFKISKLRNDENFGWQRPTGVLADAFGIVSYGITYHDELRLQGKRIEYDEKTDERVIKKLTTRELENAKVDPLSRTESDDKAFEFLIYAKYKGKEWPNWQILPPKYTGYIYLLSDGRATKIGYTKKHPEEEKRKQQLQTGNSSELELLGYFEGTLEKEKILHKKYADKRLRGEWFDSDSTDIKSILADNEIMDN